MRAIVIFGYIGFMLALSSAMAYFVWTQPAGTWDNLTTNEVIDFGISASFGLLNMSNLYHLVTNKLVNRP